MDPVSVSSSAISTLQFDERSNSLTITFTSGKTQTVSCDKKMYEEFLSAPSIGKFYNQNFRGR